MSSKKGGVARVETLTLKPKEVATAIKLMIQVNHKEVAKGNQRRPVFIWGPPGIGKSSIMQQVAKELGMRVIDIRLTQVEPTDLRGIPVPINIAKDGTTSSFLSQNVAPDSETLVRWVPPELLPRDKNDRCIILLDELPNAVPSVQAGAYQLVLDGKLGEYEVPPNCVVFAAGNRETDKGGTFKMPTPLTNRFTHIEMRVDFEDWQHFALFNGFNKDVVGYLTAFKKDLFDFDPSSASRGFATPRSWEAVSAILNTDSNVSEQILLGLVSGAIGDGVAVQFMEYRRMASKLPNPSDILEGKNIKLEEKEISIMYALTTSLCYELNDRYLAVKPVWTKDPEAKKKFSRYFDNFLGFMMRELQPELVIMGARTALAVLHIQFDPSGMKNFKEFSDHYKSKIIDS